ncbi:MAG: hypothetical protein AAFY48_00805 [Bacteroidota bacterium]
MKISNERRRLFLKWIEGLLLERKPGTKKMIGLQINTEFLDLLAEMEQQELSTNQLIELLQERRGRGGGEQTRLPL